MRTRGSFPDAIEAQLVPVRDQLITSRCVELELFAVDVFLAFDVPSHDESTN